MNISEAVRRAALTAIGSVVIDGVTIPVFDEVVNPNVVIPTVRNAKVYIILQDQQEAEGRQNFCSYRQQANWTIKAVTIFNTAGVANKRLSEDVGEIIEKRIKPTGKTHALVDANGYSFQDTNKVYSRNNTEITKSAVSFSKILIFNTTVNN
ncbi:hypothetical protein E2P86_07905 [Sphingobacterium psychroaquaticum]|uniref:hypothetical protein n=1 Tax=Sphingobacterium psychroaquaticum TaxID=561061 RepID=UPI00106AA4DA|nr:hypothetical protein [Sphingobacterium psychroaquaticum]QBQ41080.1 hypothetical protein E2P86_07905 [Sphingobacterium psychroaquaticum]